LFAAQFITVVLNDKKQQEEDWILQFKLLAYQK